MSPSSILEMDSDTISRIASEPQEHQQQREMLTRKLAVLNSGLETCRRYVGRSTISKLSLKFMNGQHISLDLTLCSMCNAAEPSSKQ